MLHEQIRGLADGKGVEEAALWFSERPVVKRWKKIRIFWKIQCMCYKIRWWFQCFFLWMCCFSRMFCEDLQLDLELADGLKPLSRIKRRCMKTFFIFLHLGCRFRDDLWVSMNYRVWYSYYLCIYPSLIYLYSYMNTYVWCKWNSYNYPFIIHLHKRYIYIIEPWLLASPCPLQTVFYFVALTPHPSRISWLSTAEYIRSTWRNAVRKCKGWRRQLSWDKTGSETWKMTITNHHKIGAW